MDVAYVGNHGFALGSEADINQPAIGAGWDDERGYCLSQQRARRV